ncbi:ATP-binding protein [Streptomyces sp.]|uniref:ATP-binding protein n=1 Tax=Streptomyces sp. TaxID=1931 RepID=UPI002F3F4F26
MTLGVLPTTRGDSKATDHVRTVVVKRWERDPRCVPQARHELRRELDSWGLNRVADSAELVLCEVLTNAVRHARAPRDRLIETRFERLRGGVRIEVHDANETKPVRREAPADADSGRGLALIDALTGGRWGVSDREGAGKLVWAVCADDGTEEVSP